MNARDERHPHELVSALLDGELSAADRAAVEAHLRECDRCRALLEGMRVVCRAAASEEPPPVPAGLSGRIAWRVRAASAGGSRGASARPWWRSPMPLSVAATLAAFGLLVGAWWLERGEPGVPDLPSAARFSTEPAPGPPPAGAPATPIPAQASRVSGEARTSPAPPALSERVPEERPRRRPAAPESDRRVAGPVDAAAPEERKDKKGHDEGESVGGVVGVVVGGVVGGVLSHAEKETDRQDAAYAPPAAPAPRDERSGGLSPLTARPVSVRPEGKLEGAAARGGPDCATSWTVPPPEGWILRSADPEAAGEELLRVAQRLGGRAERIAGEPSAWRVTVVRDRLEELAAGLRGLGVVAGADPGLAPPPGAACVEVRVAIVP